MKIYQLDQLKNLVQSCHVNFLFGSGLSVPFLSTLQSIEKLLTAAQGIEDKEIRNIVEASLFAEYFSSVMSPCTLDGCDDKKKRLHYEVVESYKDFLTIWNAIIANRDSSLLDKTINIFTTNIDNLVETAAEEVKVEFNDGFQGHLKPIFREDSFNNVLTKISPPYQNLAQIPIFNYMKIHGSINWSEVNGESGLITYDSQLVLIREINNALKAIPSGQLLYNIKKETTIDDLVKEAEKLTETEGFKLSDSVTEFMDSYKKLIMIHPRKAKFRESVLDSHFYELMRRYSNSLEQVTSILFVSGFSFADEHLAKITMRAAKTNPTLQIIVFAFNEDAKQDIIRNLSLAGPLVNQNIQIVSAKDYYEGQNENETGILQKYGFCKVITKKDPSDESKEVQVVEYENLSLAVLNKYVFNRLFEVISNRWRN